MDLVADARGMVAAWLGRVFLLFAVAGTILFDAGAVTVNYLGLQSSAEDMVFALRTDSDVLTSPVALEERARALAVEAEARLVSAEVDAQGVLRVRIRRAAKTLMAQRVDALDAVTRPAVTARVNTT